MQFSLSTQFTNTADFLELAPVVESHGYGEMVMGDHLVYHEQIASKYPYGKSDERMWHRETEWPDVWVASGMMAAVTKTLLFSQAVYVLPQRDPVLVAKAAGTAAFLSGGRMRIGVGLGWTREEFELVGVPFERRGARTDEMIEVMRKLWTGDTVEHHGEFFDLPPMTMRPPVEGGVPIVIGGISKPAMRRAARLGDGWAPAYLTVEQTRAGLEEIAAMRVEAGRSGPFEVCTACVDAFDLDGYRRMRDAGVTFATTAPWVLYGKPLIDPPRDVVFDSVRRFADEIIAKL
ncbi:MAG: TIGR03619 family F420-dependent LLM class oxidoreductase [Myxococcota bacterium]